MSNRVARVWSGTEWESISSPVAVSNAIVYYQASEPASPLTGQLWVDSDDDVLRIWNGSSWQTTSTDLSSYATIAYVSDANNIPTLDSTKVPTISINNQADSYTLVLSDAGKMIYVSSSTSSTITVPANSSVAFPIGTKIDVIQAGTGQVIVSGDSGVTVNSEASKNKILAQWCAVSLIKTNTDTWLMVGALKV